MIFEKIHDQPNLERAWKNVRAKSGRAGIDRIATKDFEKSLCGNLEALSAEIRDGIYKPLPVMVYEDRRQQGKVREIGISAVRDRVVQQAVATVLTPIFEPRFLPCSYAYRPRKSAPRAVMQATACIGSGKRWMLKMDVEKFFDSIDHKIMVGLVEEVASEKPLSKLISRLLKAKIFRQMGLFDNTVGSQQGSGLSPLLSNIYMNPVDKTMWERFGDGYLRYSDDIAVFSEKRDDLDEARELCLNSLVGLKLKINPSKTLVSHVSAGIVYLGFYMDANGKGPDKKSIRQFHDKLEHVKPVRATDRVADRLVEVGQKIRGWYNYYKSVKVVTPPNILSLVALARLSMEIGEVQYARDLVRQHEIFPVKHPELLFHIGELFQALGMRSHAERQYKKALEADPSLTAAKERLGTLDRSEDDVRKTVENMKMVLHRNPNCREGYEQLADCYSKMGLFGFAEKAAQKALEIEDEPVVRASVENIRRRSECNFRPLVFDEKDRETLLETLRGRGDAHARQWVDAKGRCGYMRVERPLNSLDIRSHLAGEETLAVYPVTDRDTVRFMVFDIDVSKRQILLSDESMLPRFRRKTHEDLLRLQSACRSMGMSLLIEDSGYKGRHGWLLFKDEVAAARAILVGTKIMKMAGPPSEDLVWELFPRGKIDRDSCLIKLPLGINRKNNRRCLFLDENGEPFPDQFDALRNTDRADPDALNLFPQTGREPDRQGISYGPKDEILAPGNLKEMVNKCGVLRHLILKARDYNYLTHYERVCLLYTLTFADEQGADFLHRVIGYCLNYDREYTQRHIDRRKASSISCAKIKENFPDLAESTCHCKFVVPARSYPSPVLYALGAEMKKIKAAPTLAEPKPEESKKPEKPVASSTSADSEDSKEMRDATGPDSKQEPARSSGESFLDFKSIFEDEQKSPDSKMDATPGDLPAGGDNRTDESRPRMHGSQPVTKRSMSPSDAKDPAVDGIPGSDRKMVIVPDSNPEPLENAGWALFVEYLWLKRERERIDRRLVSVRDRMEKLYETAGERAFASETGTVRRTDNGDGTLEWNLNLVENKKHR